ncbi:MAG: 2-amino-4-hydroxy-6-hydroxymethyldihydropteridine pyrophosphokinase [candidate division CPR1 bacterium GW2011_GWA2_42_17]|uniref:2-amino-4-hydroxy-6-hydroxymethyldihydropteridine diphosphokinase n=1 Tax=candidate division CPR1 bacterium GW2011_GWA2_42_17 TaxID=1618341 RepID=A0A0G0Z4X9_9BACT|nr:MAG: 2-amino-4-hydroxy-6-hydroxymethyldihydropteridine pyrophosphokinase [candidate division CPR1 bacterium GW2011_GWA2_42_17]
MNSAIIGLGSNIDAPQNILKAKTVLAEQFEIMKESVFVTTKSAGYPQQANFINGAVLLKTSLDLSQVKKALKIIESQLGRRPSPDKFGPRIIDLDIIVWNDQVIDQDFYYREYLRKSILELLPDLEYNSKKL